MNQTSPDRHRKKVSHDQDAERLGIRTGLPDFVQGGQLLQIEQARFRQDGGACVLHFGSHSKTAQRKYMLAIVYLITKQRHVKREEG